MAFAGDGGHTRPAVDRCVVQSYPSCKSSPVLAHLAGHRQFAFAQAMNFFSTAPPEHDIIQSMATKPKKSSILQPLGASTWPILRKSFAKYGFSAADILVNWRAIVGDELAQRAIPHRITWPRSASVLSSLPQGSRTKNGGTLIVQAEDGPSAVEIQYLELDIIERINVFYGYSAIIRLKVIQTSSGLRLPERAKKRKDLSDEHYRHLDSLSSTSLDEPLSRALYRLGERVYGRSK